MRSFVVATFTISLVLLVRVSTGLRARPNFNCLPTGGQLVTPLVTPDETIAKYLNEAARTKKMPKLCEGGTSEKAKDEIVKVVAYMIRHWTKGDLTFVCDATVLSNSADGNPRWNWTAELAYLRRHLPYIPKDFADESPNWEHSNYWERVMRIRYDTPTKFLNSPQQMTLLLALTDDMKPMAEMLHKLEEMKTNSHEKMKTSSHEEMKTSSHKTFWIAAVESGITADMHDVTLRTRKMLPLKDMVQSKILDVIRPQFEEIVKSETTYVTPRRPTDNEIYANALLLHAIGPKWSSQPIMTENEKEM